VVGGSLNQASPLVVRVDRLGADTRLASIVRLLDRAQSEKPRIGQLADRAAAWFVGLLLAITVAVGLVWYAIDPSKVLWIVVSILVVTCPCALGLATPAALTTATGRLTRLGLLTTRGHALETLARATDLVFDKTGTLTHGRLSVRRVVPLGGRSAEDVSAVAAALEAGSEHPIAKALREAAIENSDRSQPPFGLSLSKPVLSLPKRPCAHSDMPFDKLRAKGDFVMCNGKLNN
jgi:Cu2+-exporting ATPase